MNHSILPQTTLAAIVRDEMMNPAGGVERFLRAALPHVEAAVVVDTGSIDGTCDVLSGLAKEYPHLKVYHREWDNFAPSRNFSLSKVETKRVLVLDADELITHADYQILADYVKKNPVWGYWFSFRNIYPDGIQMLNEYGVMNPRLFEVDGVKYEDGLTHGAHEDIHYKAGTLNAHVEIKHFLPSRKANEKKDAMWYSGGEFLKTQPSEAAKRDGWKEFNPGRNLFD